MNIESEIPDNQRILVVDDNPSIHEDFRKILSPQQSQSNVSVANMAAELFGAAPRNSGMKRFQMESAFQGAEALTLVERAELEGRPFSLVFMDVRMPPGWDGVETILRIWKNYPHIQVVICTAYSDYSWDDMVKKLGETDSLVILKKPFDNVEVLQLAHTLTKKWMVTRQANARMADLDVTVQKRTQQLVCANESLQSEIARRSTVEAALRESEERFHKAFEAVTVAMSICSADTERYIDVNQSFASLCGYAKNEIIGRTPAELNILEQADAHAKILRSCIGGHPIRNAEINIRQKSGEFRHTLASVEMLRLGEQACFLSAFLDVTEQKQLEGQLRQAQKMEAIGQLAAGIAHDFNNLLTIIHGYTSLQLARKNLDGDIARALTQVKMAAEQAAALTRQLLAFSRQQVMQRKPLDLEKSISTLKGMLVRTLGESIDLRFNISPGLPPINADESNLSQVILNLAINARDAMSAAGRLLISARPIHVSAAEAKGEPDKREGDFVLVEVADTGCGMEQKTLARIFEPFFTTKPIGRGTGLGLSTVYGIVKRHEGWVEVESHVGKGTTFRVFLPFTFEIPAEEVCRPNAPAFSEQAHDEVIFLVEDEPAVRGFIASVLTDGGYQVLQADSGAQALLHWNKFAQKPRLLITDMVMPDGLSGTMLAKHLLRRQPDLGVIYISGYSPDMAGNETALSEGVNFLTKPFTREQLLSAVEAALAAKSAGVELVPALEAAALER